MAEATVQASRNVITLKGSTAVVTEFFEFAVSSILFQRGIYPAEYFHGTKKYGMTVMVAEQEELNNYLKMISSQMKYWVEKGQLQRMALVLISGDTKEVLEQWTFKVESDLEVVDGTKCPDNRWVLFRPWPEKADKEIHKEISAIIRQITSTITFLPLIEDACMFDLLLYTDKDVIVPETWEDRDEPPIHNASEIVLRKFSTKIHGVSASVLYKNTDSDDEANSDGNPMDYGAMVDVDPDTHDGVSDAVTV